MYLRNQFKQNLFVAIKEYDFDPANFPTKGLEPDEFEIRYKDTFLHFTFKTYPDDYDSLKYRYTIYSINRKEIPHLSNWSSPAGALSTFKKWLKDVVKKYVEDESIIDPWEQLHHTSEAFASGSNDEKFTPGEIQVLTTGLENFESFAKKHLFLEQTKLDILIQEVRDLKDELKNPKIEKRKWLRNFKGFIIQELWEAVKDDEKRQMAISYFKTMFESVKQYLLNM